MAPLAVEVRAAPGTVLAALGAIREAIASDWTVRRRDYGPGSGMTMILAHDHGRGHMLTIKTQDVVHREIVVVRKGVGRTRVRIPTPGPLPGPTEGPDADGATAIATLRDVALALAAGAEPDGDAELARLARTLSLEVAAAGRDPAVHRLLTRTPWTRHGFGVGDPTADLAAPHLPRDVRARIDAAMAASPPLIGISDNSPFPSGDSQELLIDAVGRSLHQVEALDALRHAAAVSA